jgi:hypothetical protein
MTMTKTTSNKQPLNCHPEPNSNTRNRQRLFSIVYKQAMNLDGAEKTLKIEKAHRSDIHGSIWWAFASEQPHQRCHLLECFHPCDGNIPTGDNVRAERTVYKHNRLTASHLVGKSGWLRGFRLKRILAIR